jgi:cytochrome c biogenesis protein CcmG/thiol:disulfide interchange protein DsbE
MSRLGSWRWVVVPVLVLPISWLLFTGLGRDPRTIPSPLIGKPLPSISGTTLGDGTWDSASLAGRPALINVWASWCAPCVTEHPLLLDVARQHAGQLQVVGVLYQDTADAAAAFKAHYGDGGWPDVDDAAGRVAVSLGVTGPPETFFVDADGIVRYHQVGPLTSQVLAEQLPVIGISP